jgi:predicted dienelactone hydrolase
MTAHPSTKMTCLALLSLMLPLVGCGGEPKGAAGEDSGLGDEPEPWALPADPAAAGAPVGVRSDLQGDVQLEIWYPTTDAMAGGPGEPADFNVFIPDSVNERLGGVEFPLIPTVAVRDAPLRRGPQAWPVVLFSHGFGGTRLQSVSYATHLASRGYVVIAADHVGRSMGDLLPCIFSPALEGCNLTGFSSDPGPAGLAAALAWADAAAEGEWAGLIDPDTLGVSGHSAGGGSTSTFGQAELRADALLIMAAGAEVQREVPTLVYVGSCDGIIPASDALPTVSTLQDGLGASLQGAGHLAFSDLCALDLLGIAERQLDGRDDLNAGLYAGLIQLATDGCPGGVPVVEDEACAASFLPLEQSDPFIRSVPTAFFDQHLWGLGEGVALGEAGPLVVEGG